MQHDTGIFEPHTAPAHTFATVILPPAPQSPGRARRLLGDWLEGRVSDTQRDTVLLLATELITNSVVHVRRECRLDAELLACGCVRIRVWDDGQPLPSAGNNSLLADRGRGLSLVDGLSRLWGISPGADGGKTVWCDVAP